MKFTPSIIVANFLNDLYPCTRTQPKHISNHPSSGIETAVRVCGVSVSCGVLRYHRHRSHYTVHAVRI